VGACVRCLIRLLLQWIDERKVGLFRVYHGVKCSAHSSNDPFSTSRLILSSLALLCVLNGERYSRASI